MGITFFLFAFAKLLLFYLKIRFQGNEGGEAQGIARRTRKPHGSPPLFVIAFNQLEWMRSIQWIYYVFTKNLFARFTPISPQSEMSTP